AIVEAMLEVAHGNPAVEKDDELQTEDLDGGEQLVSKATDFFLSYLGLQTSKEAAVNASRMQEAMENLQVCRSWQELEDTWKTDCPKLHNAIVHNGWDKVTMEGTSAEGTPLILARPRNDMKPTGFFKFELNRAELEQVGVTVTEAQ
ncbi:unnamed protein product, partial [Symbiodinium pilosum]